MHLSGVRPSVSLSVSAAVARPAAAADVDRLLHGAQQANADSAALSAYVGS